MTLSLLLTLYAGFTHAFETDHLLAVSNIVTSRNKTIHAVKDGMFWGFGHTSTIFFIGILILLLKFQVASYYFNYFEALVGLMLIGLSIYRLVKWFKEKKPKLHTHQHAHADGHVHSHTHMHTIDKPFHEHTHFPAYSIGVVHGLAGSGSLMLIVMSQMKTVTNGLGYLLLFGLGSVAGMMLAAGIFSLPFSQNMLKSKWLQAGLAFISAALCLIYGSWVMYQNLILK